MQTTMLFNQFKCNSQTILQVFFLQILHCVHTRRDITSQGQKQKYNGIGSF